MTVVLTGGTGLVGSAVLRALVDNDHEVLALVRSDDSAQRVRASGARAAIGDLTDEGWVREQISGATGVIHTASPGDASSAGFDAAVSRAALAVLDNDAVYVHTGGIWVYGNGTAVTEDSPLDPPALTAWRPEVERTITDSSVRTVIVVPGVVYGHGQGLPAILTTSDERGSLHTIGDGSQHWVTVGDEQLADLYVRALDNPRAHGHNIGANADRFSVHELVSTAAAAAGDAAVVTDTADDSRARLGAPLADALLLDQIATTSRARDELGWSPAGPSLLEEFRSGSYAPR